MSNLYSIVKVFGTIQGEGILAGTPAVFVRLGACNMWSGADAHRARDAERNGAQCPLWCDTDFHPRERVGAGHIVDLVKLKGERPLIVITGGEPMLQLDDELIDALISKTNAKIQIETNGTIEPGFGYRQRIHITLSPKVSRARTVLTHAHELKLVYPAYDPAEWDTFPAPHRFLQPEADQDVRSPDNEAKTAAYVQDHPSWRLSLQQHKVLGIE